MEPSIFLLPQSTASGSFWFCEGLSHPPDTFEYIFPEHILEISNRIQNLVGLPPQSACWNTGWGGVGRGTPATERRPGVPAMGFVSRSRGRGERGLQDRMRHAGDLERLHRNNMSRASATQSKKPRFPLHLGDTLRGKRGPKSLIEFYHQQRSPQGVVLS